MASTPSRSASGAAAPPRRGIKEVLKSYFYWTYTRGTFQYDVMVTLVLLFIFVTPHLWDYGAKPTLVAGPVHPMQVAASGIDVILTVQASDVNIPAGASDRDVKRALRKAIEPVMGDAVYVNKWETITDAQGNAAWKVWAHR